MMFSKGLADIYERWTLDAVIEIASALSLDVPKRSARYHTLSDDTRKMLSEFSLSIGKHPDLPDVEARKATFSGVLGRSFCAAGTSVRRTAIIVVQNGSHPSRAALLAFQDSVSAFRSYLGTIAASAVAEADSRTKPIFERAVQVLGSQDVASAFGLKRVAIANWPLGNTLSGEGALLVEELSSQLQPLYAQGISSQNFLAAQRVGHYGAQSIRQVLGDNGQSGDVRQDNNELLDSVYNWSVALQDLIPNVVRAWRDPDYRRGLSIKQQELLPDHPAGDIEFPEGELAVARGGTRVALSRRADQTYTVWGEVCCCNSMDLCDTERSVICLC